MEFRVLGPLEVRTGRGLVQLTGHRLQRTLALLLLNSDDAVPIEHLISGVWDGDPPSTAKRQLQNCISALRRRLADEDGPVITSTGATYRMRIAAHGLDARDFAERVAQARRSAAGGQTAQAITGLRSALGLWRGRALGGLGGRLIEAAAARLDEQRMTATEECLDLELRLGRHHAAIGELTELVRAHPMRERLVGQLMLALHRAGRQAEALRAYHQLRIRLVDELGLDPGTDLQELHVALLSGTAARAPGEPDTDPGGPVLHPPTAPWPGHHPPAAGAAAGPVPAQLPGNVADFTGRAYQLKELDEWALAAEAGGPGSAAILAVVGTAGAGKTALALRWGHSVRDRFPDGQLFVDLRGHSAAAPVPAMAALAQLLTGLGVPVEGIPADVASAAALYRSLLADRRVLVVLDDAAGPAQVRPLLPGGPGCVVLVTSRDRLSGLLAHEGAHRLTLDVLSPEEAHTLLIRTVGAELVRAEPDAVAALAAACSYLPLALRVAAANLADRPSPSIAGYVAELGVGDPLAVLEADGDARAAVRGSFDLSYRAVDPDARRLFRMLGLAPGPDVTAHAAAALIDVTPGHATRLLERLAGAHLVSQQAPGRYGSHELLRRFAAGRALDEEVPVEREAALRRLHDTQIGDPARPGPADRGSAGPDHASATYW
jgi:DNA-binding SARP family transcriptional activator